MYTKRILMIAVSIFASVAGTPKSSAREGRADDWVSSVVTEFKSHYVELSKSQGLPLEIRIDPLATVTSARADVDAKNASITINQGLLDSKRLSPDGLRVILCHELGHILGGAPRKNIPMEWEGATAPDGLSLMSSEGQSDYYATLVCFRKLVAGQNHTIENHTAKAPCDRAHGINSESSLICQRAVLGSENFLKLSKDFEISIDSPSADQAPALIRDTYPERQCRLDTLVAGALCPSETTTFALDFNNSVKNECAQSVARRPACWYR